MCARAPCGCDGIVASVRGSSGAGSVLMDLEVQLRAAEARKQELERAHQDALHALKGCSGEALEARQSRVRELEKKIALETVRCEELQLELSSAQRTRTPNHFPASSSSSAASWPSATPANNPTGHKGSEIERIMAKIEQDNRILAELEHSRSTTLGTGLATSASSHALGESSPPISPITMSHTTPAICYPASNFPPSCQPTSLQYLPQNSTSTYISGQYNTYPQSFKNNPAVPTGTMGLSGVGVTGLSNLTNMNLSTGLTGGLGNAGLGIPPSSLGQTNLSGLNPSSMIPNYSSLVSTNPTSSIPSYNSAPYSTNSLNPTSYSLPYNPATTFSNNVTFSNPLSAQFSNPLGGVGMNIKLKPLDESDPLGTGRRVATPCTPHPPGWGISASLGLGDTRPMSRMLPDGLDTDWALHGTSNYLNGHSTEGQVDMLDIPGKGRCSVYIARFSYEPDPETSEEELPVSAGDYLLVWSDVTSSNPASTSYLDAELLDGRRGLVPAHFCTRLIGDDLLEFHQAVLSTLREEDPLAGLGTSGLGFSGLGMGGLSSGGDSYVQDLQRIAEMAEMSEGCEEEPSEADTAELLFSVLVPAPRQLTLERQLNKSVLIGWTAPDTGPGTGNQIESYHVYVDGVLKTTVKATERTRALVEGVDSNRPHRISVRSVTANRRTSRDAACTMVIGKDTHMLGPTSVRASHVTSSQAVISWLPANSNHQHVVCVNNVEVRTVKPGVYRHTITGLAPNTQYRVTVRAKHLRAQPNIIGEEPPSPAAAHTDFRTLPKGLPDPPSDILVEPGPQDGTLLVTWHPVQAMHHPGSTVTGYAVYADGKKVTDVDSPTGDHALIDISKLLGLNPKHVTVRTKSRDSQSADSAPTPIPNSVLRGGARIRQPHSAVPMHLRSQQRMIGPQQQVIEHDENLSDKEIFPSSGGRAGVPQIGTYQESQPTQQRSNLRPVPEITKDPASDANMSEDDYLDGRRRQQQHYQQSPRGKQGVQGQGHYATSASVQGVQGIRGRGPMGQGVQGARGGPGQAPTAQKRARWFVALFDYDPSTMSPNPDACEEELPFSEGDTIKVWGDKDADGFYWGECRGRRGFVPHNMVMEVEGREGNRDRWGDIYANMPVKRMIALYDYDPQELSPNVDAEVELSFTTGSIIHVYGDMDDDGFYMGELDGVRGLVPSNFLTEAPEQYSGAGGVGGGPSQGPAGAGRGRAGPGRGHGPGARGPPPPPRDARAARAKSDACPVVPCSQLDTLNSHSTTVPMLPNTQPHASDHHQGAQAQGRGRGGAPMQQNVSIGRGGSNQFPGQQMQQQQQPQQQQQMGMGGAQRPQHRGVPAVIPTTNVLPQQLQQQMQQQQQQQQQQNTGPNLMQKFTEMTAPGGDILSKGKELIFMKFGLGGGK